MYSRILKAESRPEATQRLDQAAKLLEENSDATLAEDIIVLRAVPAALSGDSVAARQKLRGVLEKNKKHEVAEQMLKVLGE